MKSGNTPIESLFPHNGYQTPKDHPVSLWDRMFLGCRWPLYIRFIRRVVVKSRRLALAGAYDREKWVQSSADVMECIELSGGRFLIEGFDSLRGTEKAVVIVANHVSTLETVVLPALIASIRKATFVVKKSLINGPIFGPIMRSRNPIIVGRKNPREDLERVLKEGTQRLSEGTSVILFPESTRQKSFDPARFNSLGVKLAKRAGVPILPLALKTDFWGTGAILRPFGPIHRNKTIHFAFGQAMPITGNGHEEHRRCLEFIGNRLKEWQHPLLSDPN